MCCAIGGVVAQAGDLILGPVELPTATFDERLERRREVIPTSPLTNRVLGAIESLSQLADVDVPVDRHMQIGYWLREACASRDYVSRLSPSTRRANCSRDSSACLTTALPLRLENLSAAVAT